jgi:transposase-like protein
LGRKHEGSTKWLSCYGDSLRYKLGISSIVGTCYRIGEDGFHLILAHSPDQGCVAKKLRKQVIYDFPVEINIPPMNPQDPFKWRHFQSDLILLNVRWYWRYSLSYRDLEEMMQERGVNVDHSTICRWVQAYAPEIDKRMRPHLSPTNDSWRVDETYIKVKGEWKYLYRAVDSQGNTLDFMLSAKRDVRSAERFFRKTLNANHTQNPRVVNVDKNAAYPPAIETLKQQLQRLCCKNQLRTEEI